MKIQRFEVLGLVHYSYPPSSIPAAGNANPKEKHGNIPL